MAKAHKKLEGLPVVNVVLGTAGHIDHGKTALIRRLTGIDADRLKEEQARGMTIDIGYAHMVVDRRLQLGVIDVPGHERFIKNMVAGATGVGLVVLVVAADDGVMPQTREHLEIMEILGVDLGAIAITKIDLVDEELVELAVEDVRDFVAGTFLEKAPLVKVSSATGEGFDALHAVLADLVKIAKGPSDSGPLYLPVQRSFPAEGYGTVITGVATRGRLSVGDSVEICPQGRTVRVRGMEAYGNRIDHARAGHRTAVNLAEVGHKEIRRGDVLGLPGYFRAWPTVVGRLTVLPSRKGPVKNQTAVRFHIGTAETTGRAFLLESGDVSPGAQGLVQFRLDQPVVAAPGDRFVVRSISPTLTLGGGVVIRGEERKLKRGRPWVIEELGHGEEITKGPRQAVVETLRAAQLRPLAAKEIARQAILLPEEAVEVLEALLSEGAVRAVGTGDRFVLTRGLEDLLVKMEAVLAEHHRREPLSEGMSKVDLRTAVGADRPTFESAWRTLLESGRAGTRFGLVHGAGFEVALGEEESGRLEALEARFRDGGFSPPSPADALEGIDPRLGPALYRLLLQRGRVVEIVRDAIPFHADVLETVRDMIVEEIRTKGELVASEFRSRLGTTRKYIIPLLEHFDKIGLTVRVENSRFLREHQRGTRDDAQG